MKKRTKQKKNTFWSSKRCFFCCCKSAFFWKLFSRFFFLLCDRWFQSGDFLEKQRSEGRMHGASHLIHACWFLWTFHWLDLVHKSAKFQFLKPIFVTIAITCSPGRVWPHLLGESLLFSNYFPEIKTWLNTGVFEIFSSKFICRTKPAPTIISRVTSAAKKLHEQKRFSHFAEQRTEETLVFIVHPSEVYIRSRSRLTARMNVCFWEKGCNFILWNEKFCSLELRWFSCWKLGLLNAPVCWGIQSFIIKQGNSLNEKEQIMYPLNCNQKLITSWLSPRDDLHQVYSSIRQRKPIHNWLPQCGHR